jgi:mono/diheme cytochrome c family protein
MLSKPFSMMFPFQRFALIRILRKISTFVLTAACFFTSANAADVNAGKALAAQACNICHGV